MKIIISIAIASIVAILSGILVKKRVYIIGMFVVSILIYYTITSTSFLPQINEYKSARNICSVYNHTKDPDSEIAMFGSVRAEYIFYTNSIIKPVQNMKSLRNYFNSSKKRFCFAKLKDYKRFLANSDFPMYVVERERVSSHVMMLLCNQNIFRKE